MRYMDFRQRLEQKNMRLALVGMSNVGKTSLSRALRSALSFRHVEIDEGIRNELGFRDMNALARWLGLPNSEGYHERERRYLELEEKCTVAEQSPGNLV